MEDFMEEKQRIKKSHFVVSIITIIIFVAFLIFGFVYYFGESYSEFNKTAKEEFEIVGLKDNLVPQGLAYYENDDIFLVGGYVSDGSASRIYVINGETNETEKEFSLAYIDRETNEKMDYLGHCGGLKTDGNGVWFSGEGKVYYFTYDKIASLESGDEIVADSYFEAPNGADFLTIFGNKLLVGEFHRNGTYETSKTHQIETKNGTNTAVTFAYDIDTTKEYGLQDLNPEYAISTSSLVQGMFILDDQIILSTSYSLPSSHLYFYENIIGTDANVETREFEGVENAVLTYILDTPAKTIVAPCMSEEIVVKDGRLFILFENACNKYKLFTRDNFKTAYSIELPTLDEN